MDSVTQFALGAGVGAVVLGPRIGPRKAALAGGVLGTLPDLDVFLPSDDPVDSFTSHRGASHSIFVQAAVTPVIGEAVRLAFRELRDFRLLVWVAVYLCLMTHALIDAMTVYGTRIFWPLWDAPVGLGSIFIIDPLFTLPLLVAMVWAFCLRDWTERFRRALTVGLAISTVYLGWTAAAQHIVELRAKSLLADLSPRPSRVLAIPTAFNSLLWRVIAIDGPRYLNLYVPIHRGAAQVSVYTHRRLPELSGCLDGIAAYRRLAAFTGGFYRIERRGSDVLLADLRMGMTPNYSFRFRIARDDGETLRAVAPERLRGPRRAPGDLDWLAAGLLGERTTRPVEATAETQLAALRGEAGGPKTAVC